MHTDINFHPKNSKPECSTIVQQRISHWSSKQTGNGVFINLIMAANQIAHFKKAAENNDFSIKLSW